MQQSSKSVFFYAILILSIAMNLWCIDYMSDDSEQVIAQKQEKIDELEKKADKKKAENDRILTLIIHAMEIVNKEVEVLPQISSNEATEELLAFADKHITDLRDLDQPQSEIEFFESVKLKIKNFEEEEAKLFVVITSLWHHQKMKEILAGVVKATE